MAAVLGSGAPARADERACQQSFEFAQELRRKGDALGARKQLLRCEENCPDSLRRYCVTWRSEVDAELAHVLLVARLGDRNEPLADAQVRIDGEPLSEPQRQPVVLLPGAHRFEFRWRGQRVLRQMRLRPGPAQTVLAVFDEPSRATQPEPSVGFPPAVPWTIGAVGLGALVVGGAIVLHGHAERASAEDDCAPRCSPEVAAGIEQEWIAGGIVAGAGALLVGTAAIIFAMSDGDDAEPVSRSSVGVRLEVDPAGRLRLTGRF